jgi:hypothetical protein
MEQGGIEFNGSMRNEIRRYDGRGEEKNKRKKKKIRKQVTLFVISSSLLCLENYHSKN